MRKPRILVIDDEPGFTWLLKLVLKRYDIREENDSKAIKALAHKLARLVYRMLKRGQSYVAAGEHYYEHKDRDHLLKRLHKQATLFGLQLTPLQSDGASVSEKTPSTPISAGTAPWQA